jgi:hypothetical protein
MESAGRVSTDEKRNLVLKMGRISDLVNCNSDLGE